MRRPELAADKEGNTRALHNWGKNKINVRGFFRNIVYRLYFSLMMNDLGIRNSIPGHQGFDKLNLMEDTRNRIHTCHIFFNVE